jgi:hypothetical protein
MTRTIRFPLPPELIICQIPEQTPLDETVPPVNQISWLAVAVEFMRHCSKCEAEMRFYADRECSAGLIGRCSGCGDEYLAPHTRTTTEVA